MVFYNYTPKVVVPVKLIDVPSAKRDIDLAISEGADIVEIRADYYKSDLTRAILGEILKYKRIPKIYTNRHKSEAGPDPEAGYNGDEFSRNSLLNYALELKAEYVDIEGNRPLEPQVSQNTQIILSYHNFDETLDNLSCVYDFMARLDCDIVKIATKANSPDDDLRMLDLISRVSELPKFHPDLSSSLRPGLVGVCMGEYSYLSRVFGPLYGGAFTYASLNESKEVVKGQIPVRRLKKIWKEILGK